MAIATRGTNRLLSALSPADYATLCDRSVVVDLVHGSDLARAGERIHYCWFPLTGLVSVIAADDDGREAEVGVIGFDGMVNSGAVFGSLESPMRLLVQIGGTALRMEARFVHTVALANEGVRELLGAYGRALAVQAAFSALAYAQYDLEKRLARWALMCADRVGKNIDLTHEALSIMLGVRRAGVTVAIQGLAKKGTILARRGGFTICDRPGLERIAGAGYGPAEREYVRTVVKASGGSVKANTDI